MVRASKIVKVSPVREEEEDEDMSKSKKGKKWEVDLKELDVDHKDVVEEKKKKEPTIGLFALWRFATGFELLLVFCGVILSAGVGALVPVQILVFGGLVSDIQPVLANPSEDALLNALLPTIKIIVYLGAAMLVGGYLTQMLWVLTGENQTRRIRQLYVHSILRQDMSWFDAAEEGSLTTRLSADTQFVQDAISEKAGATVQNIAQFITGFIIAFVKGWRLALVLFATLPVMAGVGGVMISILTKLTKKSQDSYADAGAVAEQAIAGIRTVNSFSLHARFQRRYEELLIVAEKFQRTSGIVIGWGFGTFFLVLFGCYGLAFWYGSKLVIDGIGGADSGNILTTFLCIIMGAMALIMVPPNLSAFAAGRAAAFRIFLTIDRVPPIDSDSKEGKVLPKIAGKIQFKNVKFSYPTRPDTTILHDLSLDIKPGMTVAFVGPSGSGKSTSVGLVQRFYDPLSGSVLIDDVNIKDLNVKWIRQQIGIVSQEPVLFNMSIKENILMGFEKEVYGSTGEAIARSNPTDEEIIAVCKKANCHNFITQLPKGYDTAVGEHGGMLSGGQKQRIAIARALLKNPKILLLDEATSALDTASERLVQQALDEAAKDRTTIVIAHRLSTIRYADLIVVMDKGNLVEQGNHDQLYALGGVYTELVNKQKIKMKEDASYVDNVSDKAEIEKALKEEKVNFVTQSVDKDGNKTTAITMEETPMNSPTSARKIEEEKLQRIQSARAPIFRVLRMMRPEIPLLVAGCLGAVLAGSVFPIYGFIFSKVVARLNYPTDMIAPGPMEGTNLYAFLMIVLGVGACIAFGTQVTGFELAGARFTARMRALAFKALLRQEIGFFDQPGHSLGALTAALATDASGVNEMVTKVWGDVIQLFSSGLTGIIISFIYSWQLTLVLVGCVPFIALATALESRVHQGFEDKTKKAYQESGEIAAESFREVRTVVSLTKESYFEERYAKNIEGPHKLALRKAYIASLGYGAHQGFNMWTTATGFYAGVRFIGKGWINFEEMFVVILVMMITAGTVGRTSLFVSKFAKAKHCAINTFELLDRKTAIDPDQDGEPADDIKGNVQFKDITFRYPARPDIPIFSGEFNLGIKKRQTVALVGPSGCGKSTTIGMLQRWYDPLDGRVDVDRKYINNYSLKSLRKQMAIVQQEPVLFDLTIKENILYGTERTDVSQEELEEMCRRANILTFIQSLPDQFETRAGDKGSQLSGGQKQRIAIARALIRKPKILLLDEATSALDSESEKLVQEALDRTIEGKTTTTITIAHRLSTIQNADLICVIKNGKVAESGKHFELLEMKGIYKDLVDQQDLSALQ